MAHKYSALAKQARERYKTTEEIDMASTTTTTTVTAPPRAKEAKYLRDADGNIYLWTPDLAERGDLVAAYDPSAPEKFSADQSQIALNRELEIARERADAEEVARLEAVRKAEAEEAARKEAEELAQANARQLREAEEALQVEREENAKKLAELQAKIDALAKQTAQPETAKTTSPKKKAAKKQVEETSIPSAPADLTDFDA